MALPTLSIVNGVPRGQSSLGLIYDQSITVVASGATGNQINGPVTSGTAITLPASGNYTLNSNSYPNLQIFLNGDRTEPVFDWNTSGSGPNYTAIVFTFNLSVGDRLDLRVDRAS